MRLEQFLDEARALARRGVQLREHGNGEPVALWHGFDAEGRVISLFHAGAWITLKSDSRLGPSVVAADRTELAGKALFAETYESLPPVDAVFRFGSEAIAKYLKENDWSRDDPYNDNFKHPTAGAYERVWQDNCPMYASGIIAVSGGWLFPWPDSEWDELVSSELVVWTLADSEPWFEVFYEQGRYAAYEHVI
jgi:hypothetical protein